MKYNATIEIPIHIAIAGKLVTKLIIPVRKLRSQLEAVSMMFDVELFITVKNSFESLILSNLVDDIRF